MPCFVLSLFVIVSLVAPTDRIVGIIDLLSLAVIVEAMIAATGKSGVALVIVPAIAPKEIFAV